MRSFALAAVIAALSPAAATAPDVHIRDFAYVAPSITVAAGTTVRFVNDDQEAHTVTATDGSFDSGGLDTGAVWTHTFTKPGTYRYFCTLHPYMKGTVSVRAAGASS